MSETWVINDEYMSAYIELPTTNINFVSNNISYSSITFKKGVGQYYYLYYGDTIVYWSANYEPDWSWENQAYRTVTFETSPTGDLLTWLQANAVKQTSSYIITPSLTNVTAGASNPSSIEEGGTATLTFTANSGYNLPETVTVSGASYTWSKSTGRLILRNPTANVSVTIVGKLIVPKVLKFNSKCVSKFNTKNLLTFNTVQVMSGVGIVPTVVGSMVEFTDGSIVSSQLAELANGTVNNKVVEF